VETKRTAVYALPKIPGNHVAQLKESYNIKGLLPEPLICHTKLLPLSGYSKMLSPFIYLLYDYNNSNFFSGNKRKIKLRFRFIKWRVSLKIYTTI
jgi:hypothetical protein